ncbi:MAG: hypothetical protein MHPSP_004543, partial [Paramarteilia canceri]
CSYNKKFLKKYFKDKPSEYENLQKVRSQSEIADKIAQIKSFIESKLSKEELGFKPLNDLSKFDDFEACIGDFGLACEQNDHFSDEISTKQYRSPETLLNYKDWDYRVDVWSCACT